jgi:phosphoribosyl 1,2-cyclic phosphate phosphodiesterase
MKIKILGCGDSTGVPMLLNYYGRVHIANNTSYSNVSKNQRMRSSFILEDEDRNMLVECGPDIRQQTIKFGIKKPFDDIFISHNHADHCNGFWELENIAKVFNKKLSVYCSQPTLEVLKKRFEWIFNENCYFDFTIITPNQIVNDLIIIDVMHGSSLHVQGFRYKNFVFTPDMSTISEESKKLIKNADMWLMQCNFLKESEYAKKFHTSLPRALELIEELKPKKAILTHLSAEIDYREVSKILPRNVKLAYDGLEFLV